MPPYPPIELCEGHSLVAVSIQRAHHPTTSVPPPCKTGHASAVCLVQGGGGETLARSPLQLGVAEAQTQALHTHRLPEFLHRDPIGQRGRFQTPLHVRYAILVQRVVLQGGVWVVWRNADSPFLLAGALRLLLLVDRVEEIPSTRELLVEQRSVRQHERFDRLALPRAFPIGAYTHTLLVRCAISVRSVCLTGREAYASRGNAGSPLRPAVRDPCPG